MRSLSTATFCKHRTCPSSQALLRYHHATLSHDAVERVSTHLSSCDFCDAELFLLSKFPPKGTPALQPPRMPWHLYRLAKGLLTLSAGDITRTVEAICETGNLTLTDA